MKGIKKCLNSTFLLFLFSVGGAFAQQEIPLYSGESPNFKNVPDQEEITAAGEVVRKVSRPTLTVFLPDKEKANGSAVIICPGGGYHAVKPKRDGSELAKEFNEMGFAAFVLNSRLPNDEFQVDTSIGPLQDARQAIKTIRAATTRSHIDPDTIGIVGVSDA